MDTFTHQIDQSENWIIKAGSTIILVVFIFIVMLIINIQVPVYDKVVIVKNIEKNSFMTNITSDALYNYTTDNLIKISITKMGIKEFKVKSITSNMLYLDSEESINFRDKIFVEGKIFVKKEPLIKTILNSL